MVIPVSTAVLVGEAELDGSVDPPLVWTDPLMDEADGGSGDVEGREGMLIEGRLSVALLHRLISTVFKQSLSRSLLTDTM